MSNEYIGFLRLLFSTQVYYSCTISLSLKNCFFKKFLQNAWVFLETHTYNLLSWTSVNTTSIQWVKKKRKYLVRKQGSLLPDNFLWYSRGHNPFLLESPFFVSMYLIHWLCLLEGWSHDLSFPTSPRTKHSAWYLSQ